MTRPAFAALLLIASLLSPAAAQERVTVGTQRLVTNAALFLAAARGYFKAEGLDVEMTAYPTARAVAEALSLDATDFGVAEFTAEAFNLAGHGEIKAIAAQVREKSNYDGNEIVASNAAYARGLRKPENLAGRTFAIIELGSTRHYQIGRIASVKGFKLDSVILKTMPSLDAIVGAVANGTADATIVPAQIARGLLGANQIKLVGWYSELDEQQLGAVFASAKTIKNRRATVEKFLRAYRRAAAEYAAALLRHDRSSKHLSDAKAQAAAAAIARYVYPGHGDGGAAVEAGIFFMDADARLDAADIARQVEWFKAQGLVDKDVDAGSVVDLSFATK